MVRVSREVPLPEEGKQQLGQLSLNLLSVTPPVPTSPFLQLTGNKVGGHLLPTCPYFLFSILLISMNFPHIPLIDSQGLHPFYFRRQILSAAPHPCASTHFRLLFYRMVWWPYLHFLQLPPVVLSHFSHLVFIWMCFD